MCERFFASLTQYVSYRFLWFSGFTKWFVLLLLYITIPLDMIQFSTACLINPTLRYKILWGLFYVVATEAACKHLVQFAKAHVAAAERPSRPMVEFSRIREKDAETGCHRIFRKYNLVPRVEVHEADLSPEVKKFPYIKLSSWVKCLLDSDRFAKQFVGVDSVATMKRVLVEYWHRFKQIRPDHFVFEMEARGQLSLETTVPFFSHTDEGRSYKRMGLWVMSSAGALGRGTRPYLQTNRHRLPLSENEMGMNFAGKTWSTQFLFGTMIKTVYSKHPQAQQELIRLYAQDCEQLLHEGVTSRGGLKVHMVHVGTKGDLPALVKMGGFGRSFSHVPRAVRSRAACPGICHLCMAGVEVGHPFGRAIPFEDMSPQAAWIGTLYAQEPWTTLPTILEGLPLCEHLRMQFFQSDLWHNYHLGVSKHFIGSSFVAIIESGLESVTPGSVETKFGWLTQLYLDFWRSKNKAPYLLEISRETMGFPQGSACPIARWSKGQVSTELMLFLDYFGKHYIVNKTTDPLLLSIVSCLVLCDFLYAHDLLCCLLFVHWVPFWGYLPMADFTCFVNDVCLC